MGTYEQLKREFCIEAVADLMVELSAEYPEADFAEASDRLKVKNDAPDGFTFDWYESPDLIPGNFVRIEDVHLTDDEWIRAENLARAELYQKRFNIK
ncbi:hypothetical protein GCM10010149_88590 [Nonomuraea roseoviolacea subsp. roseoviolacea]|uniref:hypothetical protein n=1 Tax=Nonomuraea roseoviolacea TaxID=103837 RepID=UPI0031D0909D